MQSAQFQLHAEIEQRHWWFRARRQIMRRLVEWAVPADEPAVVLDVGCGTGANIAALADAYHAMGVDQSAEAVELARQRFSGVEFRTAAAPDDLGAAMADVRMLLLMDVLEHVPDDFALLSSWLGGLRPGAFALITVPADMRLWSPHDEAFGHYRRYDRARFEAVWEGLAVRPVMVSYFNSRLLPLIRLIRWLNRRRGRAAGAAGTDFFLPPAPLNAMFQSIMAGEAGRLLAVAQRGARSYSAGASLITLLKREEGAIGVREKPLGLADCSPRPNIVEMGRA